MRCSIARFHLYRYQLLPVDRHFQGDLYGAATVDELIALPSALGIYWATSNAVTVVQTLALRGLLARRRYLAA